MTRVYSRKRRIQQFPFEQLRGAAQAAERIFDFVRELADHQAAAAQLRQQRVLASQAPMLRDVLDLQEQPQALAAESHLRHGAIEDAVHPSRGRPREFALHHAFAALARAIEQRQQALGAARQFGDGTAQRLIGPTVPAKFARRRSSTSRAAS